MTMRLWTGAIVGAMAVSAALPVSPRAETPRPLVSVPLFVTDLRGQSISNLQAPEIEIAEGGTPQKVSSVVFRGRASRRVALFLDEYHVSPGVPTERARASIARFVEQHMRPEDALIVMKPLDPRAATAPMPTIEAVHRALSEFEGRRGQFEPRGEFEAQYMSTAPEAAARQRQQVVRAGLETLALSMRDTEGAAQALIIVTEGFRSAEGTRMRTTTLRSIARAARMANVPVYIVDPSMTAPDDATLNEAWRDMSTQTGGVLYSAGSDLDAALARIAADLDAHYLVEFHGIGKEDGRFHDIEVKVKRRGATVRAPSGYWAPFPASRLPAMTPRRSYANLLTPHVSGLIQPWFRMAPGADGRTKVTLSWAPRTGRTARPERVEFSAITFEGETLHAATLAPVGAGGGGAAETTFEAPPGPLQISMKIGAAKVLATDVRYIDVPRLDAARPHIASIDFVRPRSLPEFNAMRTDAAVLPVETRDFLRTDRLLVRVRAFSGAGEVAVRVRMLNRRGDLLLDLPALPGIDGASQFDLPFARFPRGDYRLEVTASAGGERVTQLLTIRVAG